MDDVTTTEIEDSADDNSSIFGTIAKLLATGFVIAVGKDLYNGGKALYQGKRAAVRNEKEMHDALELKIRRELNPGKKR